jgi:hypothetical protein
MSVASSGGWSRAGRLGLAFTYGVGHLFGTVIH